MELWFSETHTDFVKLSIKIKQHLFTGKSDYQQIDVLDSYEFGKILVIDGCVMITEKDEFIYHEMITHVPMAYGEFENILVIGAGDGGTVRELVKYKDIKSIDMIEIDEMVVNVSKQYFPDVCTGYADRRVNLYIGDGIKFVEDKQNLYDLIIIDSTDPIGPGEGLFTKAFYKNCYKTLRQNGILVNQIDSIFYSTFNNTLKKSYDKLKDVFPFFKFYHANIPTYPAGLWLFGFASKKDNPELVRKNLDFDTKYYNNSIHKGSFYLPNYATELLKK